MLQLTTIFFLITSAVFAAIHIIAIELYLYWHIVWFDIPMHALGGAVVALGFFAFRDLSLFPNAFLKLLPIMALVFLVALLWEAYELLIGVPIIGDYTIDTTIDVALGLAGGFVGYYVGNSLRKLR